MKGGIHMKKAFALLLTLILVLSLAAVQKTRKSRNQQTLTAFVQSLNKPWTATNNSLMSTSHS